MVCKQFPGVAQHLTAWDCVLNGSISTSYLCFGRYLGFDTSDPVYDTSHARDELRHDFEKLAMNVRAGDAECKGIECRRGGS